MLALLLEFARFDPRQIGPRQPDSRAPFYQQSECDASLACGLAALRPCGLKQSGRAFPHRGTADPTLGSGRSAGVKFSKHLPSNAESPDTSPRCGWCLRDLTRVKSGRACLPRQARQPRQPDRRAPIYKPPDCDASLARRLAASSNRVGRSPTGGPLVRPSDPCRCAGVKLSKHLPSNTESLGTSLRCGWCLRDLTRVKSDSACHQPRHGRGVLR